MIAYLRGIVLEKRAPSLILDVNGVGYEIFVPQTIYATLPNVGEEHSLKIKHIQKEDSETLYGFNSHDERDLFELLISVKGVGDKTVLKFLNQEVAEDIRNWIVAEDLKSLTRLPGLGGKTAKKLLLELSGKLVSENDHDTIYNQEAIQALVALGYEEKVAKSEIKKVATDNMKTADIIAKVLSVK